MHKNIFLMGFIVLLSLAAPVFGHLCHDPFRPREHLILVPEKDPITIEESGEFRIYIENTFRSTLEDVQLFIKSDGFDIETEPRVLRRLVPGERAFFLVKLRLREGFKPGDYPLRISVGARSAELRPSTEKIDVIVEKKITKPKVEPAPQIKPEEIKEEEITQEERQLPQEKKAEPLIKEEVKPLEEDIKQDITPQEKEIREVLPEEDVGPQEEAIEEEKEEVTQEEVGEVTVKVEKTPFWKKPYLYIIFILSLLGILLWRKRK